MYTIHVLNILHLYYAHIYYTTSALLDTYIYIYTILYLIYPLLQQINQTPKKHHKYNTTKY